MVILTTRSLFASEIISDPKNYLSVPTATLLEEIGEASDPLFKLRLWIDRDNPTETLHEQVAQTAWAGKDQSTAVFGCSFYLHKFSFSMSPGLVGQVNWGRINRLFKDVTEEKPNQPELEEILLTTVLHVSAAIYQDQDSALQSQGREARESVIRWQIFTLLTVLLALLFLGWIIYCPKTKPLFPTTREDKKGRSKKRRRVSPDSRRNSDNF
jgi:hypothetical protein